MKESVMEALKYTIGEGGVEVLSRRCDLNNIAVMPEKLHAMLSSIFNDEGAAVLERQVVRQLYESLGERFVDVPGYTLGSYVGDAREVHESQRSLN